MATDEPGSHSGERKPLRTAGFQAIRVFVQDCPEPLASRPGWKPLRLGQFLRGTLPGRFAGRSGRDVGSADLPCSEVAVRCWAGGPQLCGLLEPGWERPAPAWEPSGWSRSTWRAGCAPKARLGSVVLASVAGVLWTSSHAPVAQKAQGFTV
ncbi:unnamed protein product [Rangifer tarandus platyrhynchus]|uniref:Uncharacterized protein n=2 Tax=Rangifer tarandus platyrhynchus TaxID=3082113 RepID=A0ACB0F3F6_RANTA|nr:unnamed protein product [Rangifer tarandus platyrhynchus]CAI9707028.1 unnamed protein product [Rangifer tarandus platyrhynchus]